ncbi:MAG: shikimate dehydrogenase, partial [Candidatus Methanomethylophilaceae archaeon]|nr:shikimate dehydrogenase [Candidatus Methanomethylophilaceae archaeon]
LGNEFTFGFDGVSTAPGQLSADRMEQLGDDCTLIGITGHPLSHSRSPAMQDAAMRAAGINGKYLIFDSPDLDHMEDVVRGYDIRGMNVTIPYKQSIMEHLDSVSKASSSIGAVNTVINDDGKLIGDNTDIIGIE